MEPQESILHKAFLTLLGFSDALKYTGSNIANVSLGFSPEFNKKKDTHFYLFLPSAKDLNDGNVIDMGKVEQDSFGEIFDVLKENFTMSAYSKLPVYFEAEDLAGEKWSIRKCGQYYICDKVWTHLWGSFRFANSESTALSWIEGKKACYAGWIEKYNEDIKAAKKTIRIAKTIEIPNYTKVLENFNSAQVVVEL